MLTFTGSREIEDLCVERVRKDTNHKSQGIEGRLNS